MIPTAPPEAPANGAPALGEPTADPPGNLAALERRAADLTRANEALRLGVEGLSRLDDLNGFLGEMLLAAAGLAGAQSGAVLLLGPARQTYRFAALLTRDGLVPPGTLVTRETAINPEFLRWLEAMENSPSGWPLAPDSPLHEPPVRAFHAAQGNRALRHVPMRIGERLIGWLGLGFADPEPHRGESHLFLQSLADQMTLAVETLRLSEEARQAAIAREREQAAQDQIAALTETNRLLQRSATRLDVGATPEEFTKPFLEEMYTLLDADSAAQFAVDDVAGTLTGWAFYDRGEWMDRAEVRRARITDIPAWAEILAHPERPTVFDLNEPHDLERMYPESVAFLRERGCTWLVNLPLIVGGRVAWVLGVNGVRRDRLTEKNLAVFTTLARQLTLALELHRLGEEARSLAVVREREEAARARAAELTRTNEAVGSSLNRLVELTDLRAFLRDVFGQCARLTGALGGGLFFHDADAGTLRKQLGWIKGEVIDLSNSSSSSQYWQEPIPVTAISDWAEPLQIDPHNERVWPGARPWHRAQGYGWLCRVPLRAGTQAFGFMGMAFARREDLTAEKAELICAMSHQIALAVQLDRLARSSERAAVTREQEKAAREQAAELAKANAVLRRGVEQLSSPHSIRDILDQFLYEAVGVAHAAAGAVLQRVGGGTEFVLRSLTQDGAVVRFESFTSDQEYRRATGEDLDGIMRRTVDGESFYFPVAGMERWFPEVLEYHCIHGHRTIGHFPFGVGGEVTGYLALGFREEEPPGTVPTETVRTLALQASLALETQRLADEAKEGAILAERNRIARDLHDVLAQGFVGVLTQVGVLEGALEEDDHDEIERVTQRVRAIARDGLEEARRSVHALRPIGKKDDLLGRLHTMVATLTAGTALRVDTSQTGASAILDEQADWAAVKFVQQALANTLRYAAAETFCLTLAWETAGLTLTARDDGHGFDTNAPRHGIGLRAMGERATECAGFLQVASTPGSGTALRMFLPFDRSTPPPSS